MSNADNKFLDELDNSVASLSDILSSLNGMKDLAMQLESKLGKTKKVVENRRNETLFMLNDIYQKSGRVDGSLSETDEVEINANHQNKYVGSDDSKYATVLFNYCGNLGFKFNEIINAYIELNYPKCDQMQYIEFKREVHKKFNEIAELHPSELADTNNDYGVLLKLFLEKGVAFFPKIRSILPGVPYDSSDKQVKKLESKSMKKFKQTVTIVHDLLRSIQIYLHKGVLEPRTVSAKNYNKVLKNISKSIAIFQNSVSSHDTLYKPAVKWASAFFLLAAELSEVDEKFVRDELTE